MGIDFLAAQMHGRWAKTPTVASIIRLAESSSLADLAASWVATTPPTTTATLQQWLRREWTREVLQMARRLGGPGASLLDWMAVRVYLDDLTFRLRSQRAGLGDQVAGAYLVHSADHPVPGWPTPKSFSSLDELAHQVPFPALAEVLRRWGRRATSRETPTAAGLERDLDAAYSDELRTRSVHVPSEHGELLEELAVADAAIRSLQATDQERKAWKGYARIAWRLLRRGHMDASALVGYAALRRITVANLVTLTEAVRLRPAPPTWIDRLVPIPADASNHD